MHNTIKHNIAYGNLNASDDEVFRYLLEFIIILLIIIFFNLYFIFFYLCIVGTYLIRFDV